ncbi:MAG: FAD-dependent oxidoreductase [Cyclobacteriaceae bacterium]
MKISLPVLSKLARVVLIVVLLYNGNLPAQNTDYDVVVVGGTPAGIAAAISAGRMGKKVIIIEQSPVLGGMLSSGVSRLDDLIVEANSGVMEEFRRKVASYHKSSLSSDPLVKFHTNNPDIKTWSSALGQCWEPRTAARIYSEMVAEIPLITVKYNQVAISAKIKGNKVSGVTTQERDNSGRLGKKHEYTGKVIIDATYEGDLAEFAQIPYRIGREARSPEEPHAGVIYTDGFGSKPGVLKGTIFPGSTGEADNKSQAFAFRLAGKDYGTVDNPNLLKNPPPDYDPENYKVGTLKPNLPNNKVDMLGINYGSDMTGYSTKFILADWEERRKIEEIYRNFSLGWLYYAQTEGGQPNIGLAEDEFTDNNNLPYRLYVRQGRRIEGLYTLTESDLHKDLLGNGFRGPLHAESIAIGMYPIDVHNVQNPTTRNAGPYGEGAAEGDVVLMDVTGPYQIPYGVMVPKNRDGILFPVCISSTHIAISSVRMEPVWSSLGQAAGIAAALSIDQNIQLRDLDIKEIQNELLRQSSMLFFYKDIPGNAPEFTAVQKLSLLGAIDSDYNYDLNPDQPISFSDFSRLVVEGFDVPVSITAEHFEDVPRGHPGFKYIETLYDMSTQSEVPFFDYETKNYMNYWWMVRSGNGSPVYAYPEKSMTWEGANRILSGLLKKDISGMRKTKDIITKRDAAILVYELSNSL